ncbi:uncharacterized protein LOC109811713 isoform X2 [Cajanus cajan]|uniref:uncharacterized protein LOC109811713 isoform X2 n=1 Tax=Cajanus cajan TaxID=3821 RepID=UPI0010FADC49|nr:uncharacterized protein LOC109811713 isoform X2 [Cajanus cajan]
MRRQGQPSRRAPKVLFRHKPDSDESISDEDDDVFPNIVLPLDSTITSKQELPLPVRLDILKGISNQNFSGKGSSSSFEKPLEDEVEMPDFNEAYIPGEVVANSTDEETNSADGDNTFLSTRQLHKYGPQSIRNEEVKDATTISKALLRSKESASASHATCSKANISGILKTKPRFSLPSVSHKFGSIGPSISKIESLPEIIKAVDSRTCANVNGNYLDDDDQIEINSDIELAETEAVPYGFNLATMDDLFDNLQDKADQKRSRSPLLKTVIDSEDSPEPVDSGSSSDNEVNDQQMKILPGKKMQTMAERFEEALGTSSVITEGPHVGALNSLRATISGKLQQMMLKEKESDMEFWRKLQAGAKPDSEPGCIDVKIISRYHDGKLTVCHCSLGKYTENFLSQDNPKEMEFGGRETRQNTIIFSSRVCNNVDLEVGNLIRLHPPWKEVQVGNDNIILCTYFSEILFPGILLTNTRMDIGTDGSLCAFPRLQEEHNSIYVAQTRHETVVTLNQTLFRGRQAMDAHRTLRQIVSTQIGHVSITDTYKINVSPQIDVSPLQIPANEHVFISIYYSICGFEIFLKKE